MHKPTAFAESTQTRISFEGLQGFHRTKVLVSKKKTLILALQKSKDAIRFFTSTLNLLISINK